MRKTSRIFIVLIITIAVMVPSIWAFSAGADETTPSVKSGNGGTMAEAAGARPSSFSDTKAVTDAPVSPNMELAAENASLALYFNPKTTEIAVRNKKTRAVWYSNPQDRNEDTIASGYNKSKLETQFSMTYLDKEGQQQFYDNYTHCVQNQQFEVEKLSDGIRISYTLGEVKKGIDDIPQYISEERFRSVILDKITNDEDKNEIEKRFKYMEDKKVYERRDAAFSGIGLNKVLTIFEGIGYNEEQRAVDKKAYEGGAGADRIQFFVPVIYRIYGDQLIATIPMDKVKYPKSFKFQSISLLPFFGSANQNEDGYLFVPDGSGSLIYLNNGKTQADPYIARVYGTDNAMVQKQNVQSEEAVRLPVFGLRKNDNAFLAIIENGDAIANIEADISGRVNAYNTVYSSYIIHSVEEMTLDARGKSSTVPLFQEKPYSGDITVRYGFLQGTSASYSGMAAYYRDYLVRKQHLSNLKEEEQSPFFLELIGGITKKKFFLGVPYTSLEPLTTFEEARTILSELQKNQIGNIKLRFTGWFNKGANHEIPTSVSVDDKLGGIKGFKALLDYSRQNGIEVYPDVGFLRVYRDTWDFSPTKDTSRFINGKLVKLYPYNLASYMQEKDKSVSYVLSPAKLPGIVGDFLKDYKTFQAAGLSVRDMGNELNSDFNKKSVIDREEAKRIVSGQLAEISKSVGDLMLEGGNAYAMPLARSVVNAPQTSSQFLLTDESIPFYQIVYHGFVDYTGPAINLSGNTDIQYQLLKALETGSNLFFSWFHAASFTVKSTEFNQLYSGYYQVWIKDAIDLYGKINPILKEVRTQVIEEHRILADGVYQTRYGGGKTIIVNYNDHAVQVNGLTIDAKGFRIGGDRR